ncbi:MAG: hypothetical protein ACYS74_05030 [Planctomycetota bacterium]|jgi:hypothetical protein
MLCNNRTENECLGRNLFGDREWRLEYLADIRPGDIGFLLNTTSNELIGVFKAQSEAELDIEKDAWQGEFQAQVQVEPVEEVKRVKEAATILANAGVSLIDLRSGVLVPMLPVQSRDVGSKLLAYFLRQEKLD